VKRKVTKKRAPKIKKRANNFNNLFGKRRK